MSAGPGRPGANHGHSAATGMRVLWAGWRVMPTRSPRKSASAPIGTNAVKWVLIIINAGGRLLRDCETFQSRLGELNREVSFVRAVADSMIERWRLPSHGGRFQW